MTDAEMIAELHLLIGQYQQICAGYREMWAEAQEIIADYRLALGVAVESEVNPSPARPSSHLKLVH